MEIGYVVCTYCAACLCTFKYRYYTESNEHVVSCEIMLLKFLTIQCRQQHIIRSPGILSYLPESADSQQTGISSVLMKSDIQDAFQQDVIPE